MLLQGASPPQSNLSDWLFLGDKQALLKKASLVFCDSNLVLKIGIELEFYLLGADFSCLESEEDVDKYIFDLKNAFIDNELIYDIEKERGKGQIEIKISHIDDLNLICATIARAKDEARKLAKENNLEASFDALPIAGDCGSAMQFNLSLHDKNDNNLFVVDAKILQNSIAGILDFLSEMIVFCAPKNEDYSRFNLQNNINLYQKGKFTAPINISFGVDNRSSAVRISRDKKRVEFRVAAADCEYEMVIISLILAVFYGVKNDLVTQNSHKIFGNAFDAQYDLKALPRNLEEAREEFLNGKNLKSALDF